jgi:hypothetical protein
MKRLWLGCCASLLLAGACSQAQPSTTAPAFGHLQIADTMHTYHTPFHMGQVTSMAQDEFGRLLLVDHANLYVMYSAGANYIVYEVNRPAVPVWQPTGIAYVNGLLYVANGPGRDILVFRLSTMELLLRITNPTMISPQAVVVEPPEGSMVVADQGGGGVIKFSPGGSLVWATRLDGAHGLAETDGAIYATSLQTQTISKLTLLGKVVQTVGRSGVTSGRFLRPVGLTAAGGRLVVTDAYNGRITVLDGNLRILQEIGGNGPGMDAFNVPSATLPVSDGYLVADSFRERIVHTDTRWVIRSQIALGELVPTGRQHPLIFGTDARPYTYGSLPGVDVPAALGLRQSSKSFVGSFNGLDQTGGQGSPSHLDFEDSFHGGTGVTWAEMVGSYIVEGSPTSGQLEVIDPSTGMFTFVAVSTDSWPRLDSLLLADNLRLPLNQVIAPALAAFGRATQLRSQGVSRKDAFNQALSPVQSRNFTADFTTPAGRQFLQSGMTANDARQFYAAALQQQPIRVVELLEVKYLTGT